MIVKTIWSGYEYWILPGAIKSAKEPSGVNCFERQLFLKLLFSHVTSSPFQDDLEEENWGKLGGEVNTGHSFCTFIQYDHHHQLSSSSFSNKVDTEHCFHFFVQILPHSTESTIL